MFKIERQGDSSQRGSDFTFSSRSYDRTNARHDSLDIGVVNFAFTFKFWPNLLLLAIEVHKDFHSAGTTRNSLTINCSFRVSLFYSLSYAVKLRAITSATTVFNVDRDISVVICNFHFLFIFSELFFLLFIIIFLPQRLFLLPFLYFEKFQKWLITPFNYTSLMWFVVILRSLLSRFFKQHLVLLSVFPLHCFSVFFCRK